MARTTSTSFRLAFASGFVLAAGLAVALPGSAQDTLCPAGGFDICFPELDAGAPNAACSSQEEDAAAITACLGSVCRSAAAEPEPGFFSYCCARGGSVRYDDFCVFVVQSACSAVAAHCVDRCPPVELLLSGTVSLAPPPETCIEDYPSFIENVCAADPFCCTTSWDVLCASAALEASGG